MGFKKKKDSWNASFEEKILVPWKKKKVIETGESAPFISSPKSKRTSFWDQQITEREREREREMEVVVQGESSDVSSKYTLNPSRICNEDILLCVDVDVESLVEMKSTGSNGRPLTRLDSIKQAILMFIHAKLSINPDHRFAFATLSKSASLVLFFSKCFNFCDCWTGLDFYMLSMILIGTHMVKTY